nr:hypothetical protein BaRGS_031199 [Batillaria attramentaria]
MMMKLACVVLLFASVTTLVNAECVGENGDTYPDNTGPYPAGDGCNLCHCKDGNLECTDNSCGCRDYMNDVWVSEGSSVVSREGCLKCTCSGSGCYTATGYRAINETWADCVGENGDTYPDNTGPYPAGDGCNLCDCTDGTLVCTDNSCGCRDYMNNVWVSEGSSIVSADGCLRCQCSGDCVASNGDTYPENSGPYPAGDGCNICDCRNGHLHCTEAACGCRDGFHDIWASQAPNAFRCKLETMSQTREQLERWARPV